MKLNTASNILIPPYFSQQNPRYLANAEKIKPILGGTRRRNKRALLTDYPSILRASIGTPVPQNKKQGGKVTKACLQ